MYPARLRPWFAALVLTLAGASQAEVITIRADPWLPYNGVGLRKPDGYMIDLAKRIAQINGHTVNYNNMPWDDAIAAVRKGEYDCVVGAAKDDAEDFAFPAESWGKSSNAFWGMAETTWRFTGIDSLESIRLLALEGYSYSETLDAYIAAHSTDGKVMMINPIRRAANTAVSNLVARKAEVFVEDINVMQQTLRGMQMQDRVINLGALDELTDVYVACTPAKPRGAEYVQMFSDGIKALRKSGELQKILDTYGLQDWFQPASPKR